MMRVNTQQFSSEFIPLLRKLVLLLTGIILMVGLAIYLATHQRTLSLIKSIELFHVSHIEISGDWPSKNATINGYLNKLRGNSLFFVSAENIIAHIKKDVWVKSVVLRKEYPGALDIRVASREVFGLYLKGGSLFYFDNEGMLITKVKGSKAIGDFPILSFDKGTKSQWKAKFPVNVINRFRSLSAGKFHISQIAMDEFPYFRLFLNSLQLQVTLHVDSWHSQMPSLIKLLNDPPGQIGQINKISLVFPKKAVVRSSISN